MKKFLKVMIIFMGIILGVFLGEMAKEVEWIKFLSFGQDIGLDKPLSLNLGFMQITLGFFIKLNIAGILGFVASLFVINKVVK